MIILALLVLKVADATLVSQVSCDFNTLQADGRFCEFAARLNSSEHSWRLTDGTPRQSSVLDGPLSSFDNSGRYLHLLEQGGAVESPISMLSGQYCLSLDFYLVSPSFHPRWRAASTSLHIFADAAEKRHPFHGEGRLHSYSLFSRNEKSSFVDEWQNYRRTVNFVEGEYRIVIHGYQVLPGLIAIDNLKFENGPCLIVDNDEQLCDFDAIVGSADETELRCDWLQSLNNQVRLHNDDVNDGILNFNRGDYSTRGVHGGMLSIRATNDTRPAINLEQLTPADGPHCLSFAISAQSDRYHVQVIETAVNTDTQNVLLEVSDVIEGDIAKWVVKSVNIEPVVPMIVTIKALQDAVSLDSLKLTKGACPRDVDCDFTNDWCQWTPYRRGGLRGATWYIGNGRLEEPGANYVINQRKTAYVDFSRGQLFGSHSHLLGPVVPPGSYCFKFTHENQTGFDVHVELVYSYGESGLAKVQFARRGQNWTVGIVSIKATNAFRIMLGVQKRRGLDSVFKLRDTSLTQGECGAVASAKQFSHVNFHCHQTGHYIPMYRSCDGVIDCPMGEDEGEVCSGGHECRAGGIPCRRRGHKMCLNDVTQLCNSEQYCDDAADEDPRMCNPESFCDQYCLNDGQCNSEAFACDCKSGFYGKRCETSN